jgi:methylenetetrahydrofolate reductase (NADPH)
LDGAASARGNDEIGGTISKSSLAALARRGDDDHAVAEFGIEYATRQCEELLREGAPGLHFYRPNRARSSTEVVKNLAPEGLVLGDAATV